MPTTELGPDATDAMASLLRRDRTIFSLATAFVVGGALLFHLTPEPAHLKKEHHFVLKAEWLYSENGLYESGSIVTLVGAMIVALAAQREVKGALNRASLLWLAAIAALACARELDLHTVLRPEYLGDLGLRFRLDWWIESGPPLSLKLFWGTIFGTVGLALAGMVWIWRHAALELARGFRRDSSLQMLALMVGLWGVGFTFDDLLRRVDELSMAFKQTVEEGAECLGALCLLLATVGFATVPVTMRLKGGRLRGGKGGGRGGSPTVE
jgi:hypothetical protein